MKKLDLARRVNEILRENNIRKSIRTPKHYFYISDDDGRTRQFVVKETEKSVIYTEKDVLAIIDACINAIMESLKRGEEINIKGFGTLGLKYRQPRKTKRPGTEEWIDIEGRYIPKFTFGNQLRMCAKVYEVSIGDFSNLPKIDPYDDDGDGET